MGSFIFEKRRGRELAFSVVIASGKVVITFGIGADKLVVAIGVVAT